MSVFRGLIMGCGGEYYLELIYEIYIKFENRPFLWNEVLKNPKFNKSVLSRLRASSYILKQNKTMKSDRLQYWKLNNPSVKNILVQRKYI